MTDSNTLRFVLIDDDQFLLDMYALKFRQAGHTVEAFASPAEAVDKLRGGLSVDAIVTDSVMPGMDGLSFIETIKKEQLGGTPAVIMLSNQSQEFDIAQAKERGADGYIVKASAVPSEVLSQVLTIISQVHAPAA